MNKSKSIFNKWIILGLIFFLFASILFIYNKYDDIKAGRRSEEIVDILNKSVNDLGKIDYSEDDIRDISMPVNKIGKYNIIGKIVIDKLDLELPIIEDWDYTKLKVSPCRFNGSVYENNMVIAGHNYNKHFGRLYKLNKNDVIKFVDVEGRLFVYELLQQEVLDPTKVEKFVDNSNDAWDLTLFTCNLNRNLRNTFRFKRIS
ncbi:sortase [Peptoniphilus asaccharolyticus]